MEYFREDEVLDKPYDSTLMKRMLSYLAPYKKLVAASIVLLLFVSLFQLLPPYLTKLAIDWFLDPSSFLTLHERYNGLVKIAGVFAIALALGFVFNYAQIYIMGYVGQRITFDLRMQIFSHLQKMEVSFFDRNPVGRLMTRLMGDVEILNEMFTAGVVSIFLDIFALLGIIIVLCYLNVGLALMSFTLLPLLFLSALIFRAKARNSYRKVRKRLAAINSFLQENITGMAIVQVFNREGAQLSKFTALNKRLYRAHIQSIIAYAVFFPVIEVLSACAISIILWFGGSRVLEGTITFGSLVAFIQYAQRFYRPVADLSEKYNILQSAMASSERIFDLLDAEPRIKDPTRPVRIPPVPGQIIFEGVSFSYNPGEEILHRVSFKVERGEKVAIVGYTGAGKTTVINLLSRFYEADEGRILINGVDIREYALGDLRRYIATVLQDVFLFSGDVAYNIRLGDESIGEEKIRAVSHHINAEHFIEKLPAKYQEKVGERGRTLSVGERQLLSFARALVYEPKVLVLDEATSSVDAETESLVQDALKKFMDGRTSLVIAHRLSTIRYVDRIIVLHKGNVVEEGTHLELLSRGGLYRKLYELQYKDQERRIS